MDEIKLKQQLKSSTKALLIEMSDAALVREVKAVQIKDGQSETYAELLAAEIRRRLVRARLNSIVSKLQEA